MIKTKQRKLNRFAEEFHAQMIVLFGSAVKKQKQPEDFDIALFLPNEERIKYETDMVHYSKLWLGLAEALEVSPDKLDITFASPKTPRLLLYHIAKDGRLLFGKYSDFSRFRLKAVKMFFDAAPFRKATAVYLKKFIHAR